MSKKYTVTKEQDLHLPTKEEKEASRDKLDLKYEHIEAFLAYQARIEGWNATRAIKNKNETENEQR